MKRIFSNYKIQLTILLFFIVLVTSFFYFCFQPYEEYTRHCGKIKELERKISKENRELLATKERYTILFNEQKKLEHDFLELKNFKTENSFSSFLEMEEEIKLIGHYFLLDILSVGRVEKKENSRVLIPYIFSGNCSSILNFITTLENKKESLSISATPFSITTTKNSKLEVTISGIVRENKKTIQIYPPGIKFAKIQKFNEKNYIVLYYENNISDIFIENDIVDIKKSKYKLSIKNNTISFEKI